MRTPVSVAAILAALFVSSSIGATAQDYPSKPVRVLVGFTAGSGPDVLARAVSAQLSAELRQQFYVENQGGANGTLAIGNVVRSEPNGHTLLFSSGSITPVPFVYKSLRYDILKDLQPIATVGVLDGLLMLVHPDTPAKTAAEFITLARNKRLVYGSPGVGNTLHLAAEIFKKRAGIELDHVPFRGAGDVGVALLSKNIDTMFVTPPSVLSLVAEGQLRALAITATKPFPSLPDVPLMSSVIEGYPASGSWGMYFAPSGTPVPILEQLNAAIRKAILVPQVAKVVQGAGYFPDERSVEATGAFFRSEVQAAGEAVAISGIKPN